MEIEIKIDTGKDLTDIDQRIMKSILGIPDQQITDLGSGSVKGRDDPQVKKVMFPKIHGKVKETILQMIKHFNGLSVIEMTKHTDIKANTLQNTLWHLAKDGKVEHSSTKPYVWYLKGENEEIAFALKGLKRRGSAKEAEA